MHADIDRTQPEASSAPANSAPDSSAPDSSSQALAPAPTPITVSAVARTTALLATLGRDVRRALCAPANDAAWGHADEALDAVLTDPEAVATLLAAGATKDDLDCDRFVELGAALAKVASADAARLPTFVAANADHGDPHILARAVALHDAGSRPSHQAYRPSRDT